MLNTESVMTFVATTDSGRARKFYEETLGLTFVMDDEYALMFDLNGIMLRIAVVPSMAPAPYTVLGWNVSNIKSEVAILAARGIVFERSEFMEHDEDGVATFPNGNKVAWFKDPDGNGLSLAQF